MTEQERRWPQTYWEYAGLGTPEMKQRAKEAGCLNDKEVYEWLDYTYGKRSSEKPTVHAPESSSQHDRHDEYAEAEGDHVLCLPQLEIPRAAKQQIRHQEIKRGPKHVHRGRRQPLARRHREQRWNGLPMTPATR